MKPGKSDNISEALQTTEAHSARLASFRPFGASLSVLRQLPT